MNAFQATLSTILVAMKEACSFLSDTVLKMYEENRFKLQDVFSLEDLRAHSAFLGRTIDEKVLETLVVRDITMPMPANCRECGVDIRFRIRWATIAPDGSLETFGDGTVRENGQAAILPRTSGEQGLMVADFCWSCRQTVELPKGTFFQSHIQAQKRLGMIRTKAEAKREESKKKWFAKKAAAEKSVANISAMMASVTDEVETLTEADLVPEAEATPTQAATPEPEAPTAAPTPKRAKKRAPRKFNVEKDDFDFAMHIPGFY